VFTGRCKHLFRTWDGSNLIRPPSGQLHSCNTDPNAKEFEGLNITFQKYSDYLNNLTLNRNQSCIAPCRAPNKTDIEDIKKFPEGPIGLKNSSKGSSGSNHVSRSRTSVAKFWFGRKFHGVMCLIVTLFLMPVSNFLARYYKETFMDRQFKSVHLWYWVSLKPKSFILLKNYILSLK